MKKNLLLLVFIMITGISSAQYTVWEDDFDDADASDWTLLDRDGNGSNWLARKNFQWDYDLNIGVGGTIDVLGTYNINTTTGEELTLRENNFAISPAIDVSFYSGKISLILNAQPSIADSNQNLSVYVSTTPDPASFTLLKTINLQRLSSDDAEFKDYKVDISQFAGKTTLYVALQNDLKNRFIGYEIDKISVTAESLLGVDDVDLKSSLCRIKQNPVQYNLELQIAEEFQTEETTLQIYNVNGILIKQSPYKPEGLAVEELSQGIYFLAVTNNGVSQKLKFIKK